MTVELWIDVIDLMVKVIALVIGGTWAIYQLKGYREFKNWIQLDLDANLYPLSRLENTQRKTWDREGNVIVTPPEVCTHAIEFLLKFTNKGKTRIRIFNIQVGVNTMRMPGQARFDDDDGHLHLSRIHTSGNLVPPMPVQGRDLKESSFYYIEPGVEQTITYFCLIPEPREFVQAYAMFSLEQERLFPKRIRGAKGLYPHTAARTFRVPSSGSTTHDPPPDTALHAAERAP